MAEFGLVNCMLTVIKLLIATNIFRLAHLLFTDNLDNYKFKRL